MLKFYQMIRGFRIFGIGLQVCQLSYLRLEKANLCLQGAEEAAADDGMVSNGIDLSYLGVHAIWLRDLGRLLKFRLSILF